jgi:hypothetical protein
MKESILRKYRMKELERKEINYIPNRFEIGRFGVKKA